MLKLYETLKKIVYLLRMGCITMESKPHKTQMKRQKS